MKASLTRSGAWESIGTFAAVALAFVIPISTSATTAVIMMVLLAWFLSANREEKKEIAFSHPLTVSVYLLLLWHGIGVVYAWGEGGAVLNRVCDMGRLLLIPVLLYYYRSIAVARAALWAFLLAMSLTLLCAFIKIHVGLPLIGMKYPLGAVFKNHIKTSFLMVMALFFLLVEIKESPSLRIRFLLSIPLFLMVYYVLFMNTGRIGYLLLAVMLLFLCYRWCQGKRLVWAIVGMGVLIGGIYSTSDICVKRLHQHVKQDVAYYQEGRLLESSLGSRWQFLKTSMVLMKERPWFGFGTGNFGKAYQDYYAGKEILLTDNPHNEYMRVGVELGLLGLGILLFFFYHTWRLSTQLPSVHALYCQGVVVAFSVGCLFNSWLTDSTEGTFYCMMLALCFSQLTFRNPTPRSVILH